MKFITLMIINISIIAIFSSCHVKITEPVYDLQLSFSDSSSSNPNNDKYQLLINKYVKKGLAGLIMLIKTPEEGLWIGAAGKARLENNQPMLPAHLFHGCSVTKLYTATVIMMLAEEGTLKLDDKINKYLPKDICNNIGNGNKATIRQCLNHKSGIQCIMRNTEYMLDMFNNPFREYSKEKHLEYIYGESPYFVTGNSWEYSDTNYLLLAMIIDKVTGKSHANMFSERIIQPLNLENTYYKNEPDYPSPHGLVNCYFDRYSDGTLENMSDVQKQMTLTSEGFMGIIASAYDYAVFIEALFNNELINQNSLEEMQDWVDIADETSGQKYGLGFWYRESNGHSAIGCDGDGLAAGADVFYFPESNITIVLCTNVGTFMETPSEQQYNKKLWNDVVNVVFN